MVPEHLDIKKEYDIHCSLHKRSNDLEIASIIYLNQHILFNPDSWKKTSTVNNFKSSTVFRLASPNFSLSFRKNGFLGGFTYGLVSAFILEKVEYVSYYYDREVVEQEPYYLEGDILVSRQHPTEQIDMISEFLLENQSRIMRFKI